MTPTPLPASGPPRPGSGRVPAVEVVPLEGGDPAADVLVLVLEPGGAPGPRAAAGAAAATTDGASCARLAVPVDAALASFLRGVGIDLDRRWRRARATGAAGELVTVELERDSPETLLLLGVGDGSPAAWRRAGAGLARAAREGADVRVVAPPRLAAAAAGAFAEGLLLGSYRWQWRPTTTMPPRYRIAVPSRAASRLAGAVAAGVTTAAAVRLARDLANAPANVKSPAWLVRVARELAARHGLSVRAWDREGLAAAGFGGLIAVGGGSAHPPALVRMDYRPARGGRTRGHDGDAGRPVVLVGKGITFDSGGLSLKPAAAMTPMKTDMAGAAAVLAAMTALRDLGVRVPVTALLAIAENLPSGSAYRPGDVVTHYGGRTSEIANTDAEGRLVLADALAYAARELRPAAVVDVATLTGAATVALGRTHGALLTPDERLARSLLAAGEASGDRLWRLPLVDDYGDTLRSDVADACHVSRDRRAGAGAITAALFLQPFAGDVPWAHVDIAGPGRADKDRHEISRGGTGFGTRLLLRWLAAR